MPLQKSVELISRLKAQEESCLIGRKRTGPIALDGHCLQRLTGRVGVLRQIVGKLDGDLNSYNVAEGVA